MLTWKASRKEPDNLVDGAMSLGRKLEYLDEAVIIIQLELEDVPEVGSRCESNRTTFGEAFHGGHTVMDLARSLHRWSR
jgi:hypothetical protein